ncbi:hypothetical protein TNIN_220661 [Trichonephila inaurata madagascariensis]|uniref:Uncharacterized protein n=1 Tax=Trichonephila inaurata madagascariensis TaxID=2747483 RepID=A0A8X6X241_9ARAC|nr:hypothetical protein TNIN_220661 [Trichonephila inaurata madagascariensis]
MENEKWYLDILKGSMIPGVAAVIESKKCRMFSFRLCVLLCAVTGFVWQTKVLVDEYLRLHGKMYCPGTGCKKLTVKEFKELYPGEKLPNHPDGFLEVENLLSFKWVTLDLSKWREKEDGVDAPLEQCSGLAAELDDDESKRSR